MNQSPIAETDVDHRDKGDSTTPDTAHFLCQVERVIVADPSLAQTCQFGAMLMEGDQ